ncbi:Beta-1,4-galactosyltransferase 3, partial [Ophiophagus hannah]
MLQMRGRYLLLFLGVQLVVMALLYREGYRKRVAYFLGIFCKGGTWTMPDGFPNASLLGDVYANLSLIARPPLPPEELPYCPETESYTFNRAKLLNVGFKEAMKDEDWDCIFFHDVDLIPEDDRNIYTCDQFPKHVAVAMDKFGYKLPYKTYFGGVSALSPEQYMKMNGFPNNYWGWGDGKASFRLVCASGAIPGVALSGMVISRPSIQYGRYRMIKHGHDKGNEQNPK